MSIKPALCEYIVDHILVQTIQVNVLYSTISLKAAVRIGDRQVASSFLLVASDLSDEDDFISIKFIH